MAATYAIGIDLGTTNSVVAYTPLNATAPEISLLAIPQITATRTVEERPNLPSFCYLSTDAEVTAGTFALPWGQGNREVVGSFAQRQAADVPTRTVAAAKSWLAYSQVNRHDPI